MNRTILLAVVILFWFGNPAANAQTAWVHINHPKSGNFVITRVDLNTASKTDLLRLPGIGEADAQKIINNRPYRSTDELVDKNIIPATAYAKIKGRVSADLPTR